MPNPAALLQLLHQTRSLLAAHAAFGLSSYPAAPKLRRFADGRTSDTALPPQQAERRPTPAEKRTEVQSQAAVLPLSEIARQLAGCRRCPGAAPQPGLGGSFPRLMVVSDCFVGRERERGQGQLWSEEENALFWRMMAAIGLNRESVYLTNALKCPQQRLPPPNNGCPEERSCLHWLEAELRAVQPVLICALGEAAARMLLGSGTTPLLRLRKKIHTCLQVKTAQVLATYPPRLLLQHPELKQAAWEDLQLLQQRLQAHS